MRKTKHKSFSKNVGRMLCLVLVLLMTLGAMPMQSTLAESGDPAVGTEGEKPAPSVEPVTPQPAAAPEPSEETTPMPSTEPEATSTPSATPMESAEPTESPVPEETTYTNSISGLLWHDANEDGKNDSGESPVADFPVYLYLASDTENTVLTTTTDAQGQYKFESIEPGNYVVGIKAETVNGTEYLLPLMGIKNDNKFALDTSKWIYAYTKAIAVEADSEITGMDAGMRTPPKMQMMAAHSIDLATVTAATVPAGTTFTLGILTFDSTAIGNTYTITTSASTTNRIVVNTSSSTALDITLSGVTISTTNSPFSISGTSNVNLTLTGSNVLTSTFSTTSSQTGPAGLYVSSTATLTIDGSGSLNVTGGYLGAGIGGGLSSSTYNVSNANCGKIVINGGTITANGGSCGAGIGGGGGRVSVTNGTHGGNGIIEINGGTVTATGGFGAGIGGGSSVYASNRGATGGTITINGGTVTATSSGGAGIGGSFGANGGVITINGGTVTATGGQYCPGIGGGGGPMSGPTAGGAGNITITGGRITATGGVRFGSSGLYAPGIGGGYNYDTNTINSTGTIIITGGSIYPSTYTGVVGDSAVIPSPRNGTANGNDIVHMVQFTGYSDNDPFYIVAGGSARSYDYYANAHPAGIVYPWLIYPGVLTLDATNITASTADLNGEVYLVGNGYTVTSGYFEVTTNRGDYSSPVKTEHITPTTTSTSGVVESYSAGTTGLSSGTTYYYRFVIVTGGVTVYGNEVVFKTPCLLTENYLKISDGSTLQAAANSSVANGGSFIGSPPATLTSGSDSYTYIGYRIGSTTATLNSGVPTGITISADTNIYYYYAGPPIVTVSHTGASGTTATLNGIYDLNGGTLTSGYFEIFDGTSWITLTSTSSISITSATGVTASTGQVTGTTTTPTITISGLTPGTTYQYRFTVTTNVGTTTATGSFTAGYAVTEKFVNLSGSTLDSTGLPDNTVAVSSSYTASGIPTSHPVGGSTYTYLGYKLDSYTSGDALTSGTPSSLTITGNRNVYYVYGILVDVTVSKTITGAYADMTKASTFTVYFQDSGGTPLTSGTQFTYTGGNLSGSSAVPPSGGTLTLNSSGAATFTLQHGQTITIAGVSATGKVRIVETTDANYTATHIDSNSSGVTVNSNDTGVLGMTSTDRTFDFTNTRNTVVPGGISTGSGGMIVLALMALLALAAGLTITIVCRRRARVR